MRNKMAWRALAVLYYVYSYIVTELFSDPLLMKFLCVLAVSARSLPAERIFRLKQMKPLLMSSSSLRLTWIRWSSSLLRHFLQTLCRTYTNPLALISLHSFYRLWINLTQIHLMLNIIFFTWRETESTSCFCHCFTYFTSLKWSMMMIVEQSMEWELAGEIEVLWENLLQCHFVNHKSHMTWPGLEPRPPRWETGD
jgi:hypothetical protein